eukprot:g1606.t1
MRMKDREQREGSLTLKPSCQTRRRGPMTEGLQVNLCGSSAKVPLAPEDGLAALKSRVAGAFNLSAPFDLMGPEGRLKTDEDGGGAVAGRWVGGTEVACLAYEM